MKCRNIVLIAATITNLLPDAVADRTRKHDQPVAVVVAFKAYQNLPRLNNTLDSAVRLALELQRVGYQVTLVTESPSVEQVTSEVRESGETKVQRCDTAAELSELLTKWRSRHFRTASDSGQSSTPFGLICFCGHGQRRRTPAGVVDFLLTAADGSGTGGVSVSELRAGIGQHRLPIVLIFDCCRTFVDQADPATSAFDGSRHTPAKRPSGRQDEIDKMILKNARNLRLFSRQNVIRKYPNAISPVTTYWAAVPGRSVADAAGADFTSWLAEGIQWHGGQFYARERRSLRRKEPNNVDDCPLEGRNELSLASWFKYAAGQLADSGAGAVAQPQPGYVDEIMICASRKGQYQRPPLNLLGSWDDFPATALAAETVSRGIQISRKVTSGATTSFAVSHFSNLDEPLDWSDSTLIIDLVAEHPAAPKGARLQCLIQPGDYAELGSFLTPDYSTPYHLPYGVKTRVAIPLQGDADQKLTSLAISTVPLRENAWPDQATVTVTRLLLAKNTGLPRLNRMSSSEKTNLMTRWWNLDSIPAASVASVNGTIKASRPTDKKPARSRYLKLRFKPTDDNPVAGRGGPVYAPPYVNRDFHQLKLKLRRVEHLAPKAADRILTLRIFDNTGRRLLDARIAEHTKKLQTFGFEDNGFADVGTGVGPGGRGRARDPMEIVPAVP